MSDRLFDEAFLQRLERLALMARKAAAGTTQGERRSRKLGQSVEFTDYRPYVPGDDFRRIDWNAYARLEKFFLKLFIEEEDLTVHFLLDASPSMFWGTPQKLEYAARLAGALGYITLSGLDRVTVTALGDIPNDRVSYFPPMRGKRQAMQLFAFLQSIMGIGAENEEHSLESSRLLRQMRAYAATAASAGMLILISDLMGDEWREGLRTFASKGYEITVVHVLSPEETDPQLSGEFRLLDSEGRGEVEITADYETLENYRQNLAAWRAELGHYCASRQMIYIPVQTDFDLEDLLFAYMRHQGALR